MNFKKLMTICLTMLGIPSFSKNDSGAFSLSDDERKKIASAFGEEFTAKFEKQLSDHKEEASAALTDGSSDASANAEDLMQAVRNHNASQLTAGLKDLQTQLAQAQKEKAALQETVLTLSASAEDNPTPEFDNKLPRKEGVSSVMKVNMKHKHYAGVSEFLQQGVQGAYTSKTIDVEELRDEFGTFLNTNRNNLDIIRELVTGFTSAKYFTDVPATTQYRAVRAFITSVVQQFTNRWTPLGKVKFTPLMIENRRHKINYPIIPSEVLDSYMFALYDESLSPDQMPITKWIWNNMLYPQILQDIELRMAFKGKYVAKDFDSTVAGIPEDSMDGLETILVEAQTSGDKGINFYNGAGYDYKTATDDQVLTFFEGFVDYLTPMYKTAQMNIFVSHDHLRRYQRAYKNKWGQNSGQAGDFGTLRVDYSLNTLVALDGMYGSPIVFSTPKQNMVKLRHKNEVPNVINDVQKHDYEVRLYGEFWLAVGFAIGEAVFAYVPAGYNPKAQVAANWGSATEYQTYHHEADGSGSPEGGI